MGKGRNDQKEGYYYTKVARHMGKWETNNFQAKKEKKKYHTLTIRCIGGRKSWTRTCMLFPISSTKGNTKNQNKNVYSVHRGAQNLGIKTEN